MSMRVKFMLFLCVAVVFLASCSSQPSHLYIANRREVVPIIPDVETFIYQGDERSIVVYVETMLPYYFFAHSEGLFKVCYDTDREYGGHSWHDFGCNNVGFIDTFGNVVIPLEHSFDRNFDNGVVVLRNQNFRHGVFDRTGEIVIPFDFNFIGDFNEYGHAIATDFHPMSGIINRYGDIILPFERARLRSLTNGLVIFSETRHGISLYGLMNIYGDVIIPARYHTLRIHIDDDLVYAQYGGPLPHTPDNPYRMHGFYDTRGNVVIPVDFYDTRVVGFGFSEGLIVVMSLTGDIVATPGSPVATRMPMLGFMNKMGELVIPTEFNFAVRFVDGLALVGIFSDEADDSNMLHGFIDTSGYAVVPIIYASASQFSEGLAAMGVSADAGVRYGYVNMQGETVIPYIYEEARPFENGYAWVRSDNLWGMINAAGDVIIPNIYQNYVVVSDELVAVMFDNLWGLVDLSGNVVAEHQFDSIGMFSHGMAVAQIGDTFGVINSKGEIVVPATYDGIQIFDDFIIVNSSGLRGIWRIRG